MKQSRLVTLVLSSLLCSITFSNLYSQKTGPIPKNILFDDCYRKRSPQLSPDGTKIAYAAEHNATINLWIRSADGNDDRPISQQQEQPIKIFMWQFDSKHILFLQDTHGNENFKLYRIDTRTGSTECYTQSNAITVKDFFYTSDPNVVIISLNDRDPKSHDLYQINLDTHEYTLLETNPGDVSQWLTTPAGKCIARKRLSEEAIILDIKQDDSWVKYDSWEYATNTTTLQESMPFLLHCSPDGNLLYMLDSRNFESAALVTRNCITGERHVIAYDPNYDIAPFQFHFEIYELLAPTYLFDFATAEIQATQLYKNRLEWLIHDATLLPDFDYLKTIDSGDLYIQSRDGANNLWLVRFMHDHKPDCYWLYNRTNKQVTYLFSGHDKIEEYACAQTEPITYTARDGLTIPAYLTKALHEHEDKPLIVYVHGGPWIRDIWVFNPIVQYFASRGFSVLQPNFRGSTGYGTAFLQAGNHQWGGAMHTDILDGVQWAIDIGIANPKKIIIFGVSYGGYEALLGATHAHNTFCCAIDIAGISNLNTFTTTFIPHCKGFLKECSLRLGTRKQRDASSPLLHADSITIPILVAQGTHDARVVKAQSDAMVQTLQERNLPHKYLVLQNSGHGLPNGTIKRLFFDTFEEFLNKYICIK